MTREQKLEAALRDSRQWVELTITNMFHQSPERYDILKNIDAALATPPTSEWNEAIEAAALFCEDVASALDVHGHFPDTAQKEITDIANSIRVLKRKEQ